MTKMKPIRINIKPLSVNSSYQGRKVPTRALNSFKKHSALLLPEKIGFEFNGLLEMHINFGVSSKLADIDNLLKSFIDATQTKYDYNDRYIYKLVVEKFNVKKGEEYIEFKFKNYK